MKISRRNFLAVAGAAAAAAALTACGGSSASSTSTASSAAASSAAEGGEKIVKVALTCDTGTIDDESFNQACWTAVSAAINVGVLDYVGEHIAAGMTTNQIDQMIYDYTVEHGGTPADLNYEGYPKSVCTSINDVVCHGIPCDTDVLHEGDIINVDCSTILDGYFSDSSRMFCIGEVSAERQRLVDVTRASVEAGLAAVKPWLPLSVMAEAVQKTVEDAGFSVVREYGGHGIGKEFHEDPFVGFTTEAPDVDTIMAPGMVFTIEPMVNAGAPNIKISKGDGWCVRTKDGSDSAQCEVQLVVTEDGYELLSW